jgi:cell division septum initiation protein DivIVA
MDVNAKIDELIEIVESARAMPMSASCVVNRAQVLELLDGLKTGLPDEMDRARRVLSDRESVVEEGRREAERLLERTRGERDSIINNTDISREAQDAATRILSDARREADQVRNDADEYVDQKLANFEVVLTKTLQAVGRGRDKMRGSSNPMEELGRHVDEADAVALERKRSRDFSGTGEIPKVHAGYDNEGYDSGSFETTGEFTRTAFEEADRPYEAHPQGGYAEQGEYDQQGGYQPEPYYAPQANAGYAEQPQQGYGEQAGYDQGAVQGYGNGEFAEPQYQQQEGYDQNGNWAPQGNGYAHPGQQQPQGPGAEYPADETSYFDTGLIDVRQFQQQQQYR